MAVPTTFAPVKPGDFTLRPVIVHKRFVFGNSFVSTTGSGYNLQDAVYSRIKTPFGSNKALNDPINSIDNSYQHIIWNSINHLYYEHPYDPGKTFEHTNRRFTYKHLGLSASILSVPYFDYGEKIKPGSVEITSSGYFINDDGNGNLYDSTITTSSYAHRWAVVGYWGFNEVFRKFKRSTGLIRKGVINFNSHIFEPNIECGVKNVWFKPGVPINNTGSGIHAQFDGQSYIMTHNRDEFNFTTEEDYTISFWLKCPVSQSNTGSTTNGIITKKGSLYGKVLGTGRKLNHNGDFIVTKFVSSSLHNSATDIYPYDFEIANQLHPTPGKLFFKRSDGTNSITLQSSSSLNDNTYHHICVTKSGSLTTLYVDKVAESSGSDVTNDPVNKNVILFGSDNLDFKKGFSGSLDEIRFYDYAVNQNTVNTLGDNTGMSLYQTAVIGNCFYRMGHAVVSPLDPKYNKIFKNTFTFRYRGTHTIYQYEALCRVKKGSFNLTMNPSARRSFKSDLLNNDMTGSLLAPYATTIGLYNADGDLVAIGKLGQPIQMRDDVDINFLVQWDA